MALPEEIPEFEEWGLSVSNACLAEECVGLQPAPSFSCFCFYLLILMKVMAGSRDDINDE